MLKEVPRRTSDLGQFEDQEQAPEEGAPAQAKAIRYRAIRSPKARQRERHTATRQGLALGGRHLLHLIDRCACSM